jgi:hypothetical protein
MPLPRVEPGYPYEQLTPEHVADIQRMRDSQVREMHKEIQTLAANLARAQRRLNQIEPLLEEMGIDIDVMLATREAFKEK